MEYIKTLHGLPFVNTILSEDPKILNEFQMKILKIMWPHVTKTKK